MGKFYVIVGKSDCGKSTLLHLLGLLDTPTSGKIKSNEKDITRLKELEKAVLRNTIFGFVFQAFHLENMYNVFTMLPCR